MAPTQTTPPLAPFVITGMVEKWFQATPESPKQPAGSCWHCGQAIAYCVQIQHIETGEHHEIGTTCGERVGLDKAALKQLLAEKFANERAERSAAERRAYKAAAEAREAAKAAAPHGTLDRFDATGCCCLECIQNLLAKRDNYSIEEEWPVVVDLATGNVVDAEQKYGQYGAYWRVNDEYGTCVTVSPKRRSTQANKGYIQATAPHLIRECRNRRDGSIFWVPVFALGSPIADNWGVPIKRP